MPAAVSLGSVFPWCPGGSSSCPAKSGALPPPVLVPRVGAVDAQAQPWWRSLPEQSDTCCTKPFSIRLGVQGSGWRCSPGSCLHVEEATGMTRTMEKIQGQRRKQQETGWWEVENNSPSRTMNKYKKNKSSESPKSLVTANTG